MEQNIENKIDYKSRLYNLYRFNKKKLYIFVFILITILIGSIFLKYNINKKDILISENYIKAGVFLSLDKKEEAIKIYEEIIFSKNEFYSILALNTLLDKNLISQNNKILDYFNAVEKIQKSSDQNDIIKFKKALFLLEQSNSEEGNNLLKNLVDKNSKLKPLAEEILSK